MENIMNYKLSKKLFTGDKCIISKNWVTDGHFLICKFLLDDYSRELTRNQIQKLIGNKITIEETEDERIEKCLPYPPLFSIKDTDAEKIFKTQIIIEYKNTLTQIYLGDGFFIGINKFFVDYFKLSDMYVKKVDNINHCRIVNEDCSLLIMPFKLNKFDVNDITMLDELLLKIDNATQGKITDVL